jgi:hypothetical protein
MKLKANNLNCSATEPEAVSKNEADSRYSYFLFKPYDLDWSK